MHISVSAAHGVGLTAVLFLLHTGTMVAADVRDVRGHGREQGVAGGNWPEAVVPYQLLHFTGPGVSVGAGLPGVCRNVVEGDGAVVEVQCGRGGHVGGGAALVEIRGAVAENGLLFDGPGHQL